MFERAARERLHRLGLAQREERLERLRAERRASALRHALEERLGERLRERRAGRQLRRDDERAGVLFRGRGGRETSLEVGEKTRDGRRRDARHRRQRFRQEHRVKRRSRAGRALREKKDGGTEGESHRVSGETSSRLRNVGRRRERAGFGDS